MTAGPRNGAAAMTAEDERLRGPDEDAWRLWGTFLPERQWGTVREDVSADGRAWDAFPYADAHRRAYRSGEDGLLGWCDREARLCFSTALWNGRDDHMKERLFGLSNGQGNHGEDVKELYHYIDAVPSGSYARALYRYPQGAFPYDELVAENGRRGFDAPEHELLDTGALDNDRYFDLAVEYGKRAPHDVLIRLTLHNRGPEAADLAVVPTLTFRNTWSWGGPGAERRPEMWAEGCGVLARHDALGTYRLAAVPGEGEAAPEPAFAHNDTAGPGVFHAKDSFHRLVVGGEAGAVDPARRGTRAALPVRFTIEPGGARVLRLRLVRVDGGPAAPLDAAGFDACLAERLREADAFHAARVPAGASAAERAVMRQAYAGLLWSKQAYLFDVKRWVRGEPGRPAPAGRADGPNGNWTHLRARDVISMPDKWEYPWFAAWDLAFHVLPMAEIDPGFAKAQLLLMLDERYMHPNGALPAYEFGFGDANPPVHAFAVWRVFTIDRDAAGRPDLDFLERAFQRLLLNFTWWVNRNDAAGRDLFGGGFLGLDNIGLFDRNQALPPGTALLQADATAWMGLYCTTMQTVAVELAQARPLYQDMGVKFFHHFILIVDALNTALGTGLWDEGTGFFYDQLREDGRPPVPLLARSAVGALPILASAVLRRDRQGAVPDMVAQIRRGFAENPEHEGYRGSTADGDGVFVALVPRDRLVRVLSRLLDEGEFLSPHGLRSLSKRHAAEPVSIERGGKVLEVHYVPGEGDSGAFGGNSNWRGPVWFPVNVLVVEALRRAHLVYGEELRVECPTGSGVLMTLDEVADELARRLVALFVPDADGRRPCHGAEARYAAHPGWRDLLLFNEYFHGDTGRGVGASHQTGWTAAVTTLIRELRRAGGGA